MKISKTFSFEAAHIVKDAKSQRCRCNIHGHSYKIQIFIKGLVVENGMVIDFGCLTEVKKFVDLFDHALLIDKDNYEKLKDGLERLGQKRMVVFPVPVTAENLALFFQHYFQHLLNSDFIVNVRVHETETSYAETDDKDFENYDWFDKVKIISNNEKVVDC